MLSKEQREIQCNFTNAIKQSTECKQLGNIWSQYLINPNTKINSKSCQQLDIGE